MSTDAVDNNLERLPDDIDTDIQMSPGMESILRATFAKFFYYNDENNFLKIIEAIIPFNKEYQIPFENDKQIQDILKAYKLTITQMNQLKDDLFNSKIGELYLTIKKKLDLRTKLCVLEQDAYRLRTILTTFIIVTMEKKDIMKEEYTMLKLTKLPLTLKGIKGMSEKTDDEDDDDYEDDY